MTSDQTWDSQVQILKIPGLNAAFQLDVRKNWQDQPYSFDQFRKCFHAELELQTWLEGYMA